jgi:N-hydroxyarylamine O-acetyltransferase
MNKNEYLIRIGYSGNTEPSLGVLRALQEAHLTAVPFENLDIRAGRTIALERPLLYRKIITMKRGGFCYELNGLFDWLLRELEFNNHLLAGQVYDQTKSEYGPEFDHMLCLTEAEGRKWLADVGFGDFSMHPLAFTPDEPITDKNGKFLIERDSDNQYRVSRYSSREHQYIPQYRFSTEERQLSDFAAMCSYHQTSPASHFTRNVVCSIATPTGRITLADNKLILTDNGTRTETLLRGWQEYKETLLRYFNISWPESPLRIPGLLA